VRLLSLNAWGGRLADVLLPWLSAQDPDVLCLQEVTRAVEFHPGPLWFAGGAAPLLQRPDLFAEVSAALPGHDATFCPAMHGHLHDEAGRAVASAFGIATFVRRGIPVLGQVQGFVHGDFRAGGWGPPPVPRCLHGVRLPGLRVAHLHGLRDPTGKHDTPARAAQAERIAALLGALGPAEEPLVLCGDLNLLPGSATFERLAALGLRDLVGEADTRTSHYAKTPRSADYLLVTTGAPVARFEVVAEPEVSDHRALRLTTAREG
jgi:endonuclease/exonuclease/phosphatase family metal-dependent hydrolase